MIVLAGIGVLALVAVVTLLLLSHFGVFGFELEHRPSRKCESCGEWFVVPNERETMCYFCIAGEMQKEMENKS
jgi:hypothetical protein